MHLSQNITPSFFCQQILAELLPCHTEAKYTEQARVATRSVDLYHSNTRIAGLNTARNSVVHCPE